jgi:hypothetical protein
MSQHGQDFTAYLGRDVAPIFTVQDAIGAPVDLSAVQDINWDCQANLSATPLISKSKTGGTIVFVTNGTDGKFQVKISPTDIAALSGYYIHQAWITDASGAKTEVATGRFRVGRAPTWTYTGDPANSQSDALRFVMGDTNHKDPQFWDSEIAFALTQETNLYRAAANLCRSLAAKYAREADSVQNELRTMYSSRSRAYAERAKEFDAKAANSAIPMPYAGGISNADKLLQVNNPDRVPPQFNLGMDDNYIPVGPVGNEVQLWGAC